jgi:RHS repeat-associated protein
MLCNVNIGTGDVYHFAVDLFLRGPIPLRFIRNYDSGTTTTDDLGHRWRHNHGHLLELQPGSARYFAPDGTTTDIPLSSTSPEHPPALRVARSDMGVLLTDAQGNLYRFEHHPPTDHVLKLSSQIDPRGNRLDYEYDARGHIQSIRDADHRVVVFERDVRGRIVGLSAEHPRHLPKPIALASYQYDGAGDLRAVRDRNGGIHRFAYRDHRLVEHTTPLGGKTFFDYDTKGRCTRTWRDDNSYERRLLWDDDQRAVEIHNSRRAVWRYTLNEHRQPLLEVDPLGRRKEWIYDDSGNLLLVKDEAIVHDVTIYFADRRVLLSQTGPTMSTVEFDERMRPIRQTDVGATWLFKYDEASNRIETIDPSKFIWRFSYDHDGWLRSVCDPRGYTLQRNRIAPTVVEYRDSIGVNAVFRSTGLGLLESTQDGNGHVTTFEYAPTDRLTAIRYADGASVRLAYDAMGNMTEVVSESGSVTRFEYDRFGAPVALINALGDRGTFRYDSEGNLIGLTGFDGQEATLEYDLLNRVEATRSFDGRAEAYTYGTRGAVSQVRDGSGQVLLDIDRDDLGRITRKRFPGGWEVTYAWGDNCQLLSAANPHATVTIDWTADLRVAAEHVNDFSIFYDYDEVGNRKRLSTSDGRIINYTWDARNRVIQVEDVGRAVYEFTYDDDNLFRDWHCPSVTQHYDFDVRHRMIRRVAVRRNGLEVARREYEYDAAGRLTAGRDPEHGNFFFRYSPLGAILEVLSDTGGRVEEYAYDHNENLRRTWDGEAIRYAAGNRLVQAGTVHFEHDARGAIIRMVTPTGEWLLHYDPEGRLAGVVTPDRSSIEYAYDPLGRRIGKSVDGKLTRFFWDQGVHLAEKFPAGGDTVDFLFLPGTLLPLGLTAAGVHYSFILDQAGTPVAMVDPGGDVAWRGAHTAFGEPTLAAGAIRSPFRFQGQYVDEETGFYYNFARYYYPRCARYLTQDPLGLAAGANVYRYVLNPFNWIDPFGLYSLTDGVLTINPICGWNEAQQKDAQKKMDAMNSKIGNGITLPKEPVKRCGATAKDVYEDCQKKAKKEGKPPLRNLNEGGGKCTNEQADHILEICAGGAETAEKGGCDNLQPLNESVNKSYGSQVGAAVRDNPGALVKSVQLAPMKECTDRGFQC